MSTRFIKLSLALLLGAILGAALHSRNNPPKVRATQPFGYGEDASANLDKYSVLLETGSVEARLRNLESQVVELRNKIEFHHPEP